MLPLQYSDGSRPQTAPALTRYALVGLLGLCAVTIWLPAGRPMLRGVDAAVYCQVAKETALRPPADWATVTLSGAPFHEHPPGFMYLMAGTFALFGATTATALAVAHSLMTLLVLLIAHSAWLAAGASAAVGALLSLCLQSGFWVEAHNPMLELPTNVGLAAGLWGLLMGGAQGNPGRRAVGHTAAILGPAFALCCKGPVGLLGVALAASVACAGLCSWRRAAATAALSLVTAATVVLGFEWARRAAGLDSYLARYWAHQLWPSMVRGRHHPVASFAFYGPILWRWYGVGLCLVPAAALGVLCARRRRTQPHLGLMLIAMVWVACVVLGFSVMRQKYQWYMHSALPGFALLGGACLALCPPQLQRLLTSGAATLAAAAALAFLILHAAAPHRLVGQEPACLAGIHGAVPVSQNAAKGLHIAACCGAKLSWREHYVALFVHGTTRVCHEDPSL